jgi:hypothetical protein
MTETAEKTVTGFVQQTGQMTAGQLAALRSALSGDHPLAFVVMPAANFTDVQGVPNRLFGTYINDDGEAV